MLFILNVIFDIFIFQNCLIVYIPQVNYIDELFTFMLIILSLFYILNRNNHIALYSSEVKTAVLFFILLFVGAIGNLLHHIQPAKIAIYKDILAISKFVVCYICTLIVSNNIDKDLLLKKVAKRSRIYLTIIFVFLIINVIYNVGMSMDVRYGIRSYKFLYQHPTYLVSSIVIFLCVILSDRRKKFDIFIIFEAIVILLFTLRNKAFVFVLGYIFMKIVMKYTKSIKIRYILILAVIGIFATYSKIMEYASYYLTAARPALFIVGYMLARRYFPFGSGFGTFASEISGQYYSPIYYEYGINVVTGLEETAHSYIGDTFWPYVYGQFGFLGLVIFLLIILNIFKSLQNRYHHNKKTQFSAFLILLYILIASTAEAIFTDVTGCFSFAVIAGYLGNNFIGHNYQKKCE
ncbi:MAG: hypothetical protein LLF98_09560 [Clostridium sp.]|uniref:hypothetical protein n=1 Tax=Clostridium sp. TaxID=1506 RepID=UPI0025C5C5D0|nr:hypothetical protein [Clostridium sp.]MCE5221488.1 hypothetical protein [Clostridium sp.]